MASRFERAREEAALTKDATTQAHEMALAELRAANIEANTPAGREFMFRVGVFGIMLVQPPRPEFNSAQPDITSIAGTKIPNIRRS